MRRTVHCGLHERHGDPRQPFQRWRIAEKIVHDMDKPKPEVVMSTCLVLETSKSTNSRTLGLSADLAWFFGKGLQFPIGVHRRRC